MDRDLLFDVRLQQRHLAKKALTPEELEAYWKSLPDAAQNVANPQALSPEAAPVGDPGPKAKGSRKR
ncbi:MAG TPA: hypothetical protein PLQ97_04660 [Myxococcota bacterium]|nr:hypothetical protein [Myxococcota bacterium]HQK51085.1 hypothetical protein [Myxococcota bacterium]